MLLSGRDTGATMRTRNAHLAFISIRILSHFCLRQVVSLMFEVEHKTQQLNNKSKNENEKATYTYYRVSCSMC